MVEQCLASMVPSWLAGSPSLSALLAISIFNDNFSFVPTLSDSGQSNPVQMLVIVRVSTVCKVCDTKYIDIFLNLE